MLCQEHNPHLINLRVKYRLVDRPVGQVSVVDKPEDQGSVGGQIITKLRYTDDTLSSQEPQKSTGTHERV